MSERLKMLGRLAELRLSAERLEMEIEDCRKSIRELLVPVESPEEYEEKKVSFKGVRFAAAVVRYRAVLSLMADIRRELGEET